MPYLHSVVEASRRLKGGETFTVGDRELAVLHTPGHSTGHICLWSAADGLLFSGDHILGGITPPVTFERGFDANPLESYLDSLAQIADLHPRLVLPGHGRAISEGTRRVQAIIRNKQRRLDAVRALIESGPRTVPEITDRVVASAIVAHQRNMALAETLAHIACLRYRGLIERRVRPDGVYEWYSLSS
jgi:glyoxylase-like metal-dependent hydrolase (beta-lactamase superfamily II)